MKNLTIRLGIIIFVCAVLTACENFLEEQPNAVLTEANFYKTESDAKSAIDALYASVQSGNDGWYYGNFYTTTDVNTDDMFTDPGVTTAIWQAWSRLNLYSEIGQIGTVWNQHYATIGRANAAIQYISPSLLISDQLIGQAKFFRALAYFDLIRYFGDVPLTTSVITNLDNAFTIAGVRTPSAKVYELIEQDLHDAEAKLPDTWTSGDMGRVTAGSAKGLLAKVYLTWAGAPLNDISKFKKSADKAGEVVNNRSKYGYGLEDIYLNAFKNNVGKESLFEAQMISGIGVGLGGSLAGIATMPRNLTAILGSNYRGNALMRPTPDLVKAFNPTDLRYKTGMFSSMTNAKGTVKFDPHVFKFIEVAEILDRGLTLNDGGINTKVLRFADVLLIYAEALNEVNSAPTDAAYGATNEVRKRAGLINLTGLDKDTFRKAVYLERRLELFGEGHRWFDLIRQGKYISTMQNFHNTLRDFPNPATTSTFVIEKNIQSHFTLMPIPKGQLDILELDVKIQNPGY